MKKDWITNILLILLLFGGLSLLLYPTISDYWNSLHQSKAIVSYAEQIDSLEDWVYTKFLDEAKAYNEKLLRKENRYRIGKKERAEYESLLDLSGTGIMGYVEIPVIDVSLPIYHGTKESVLQIALGHLEWTSLPIGGKGTHAVISGHRGLPSAKLLSDLDKMKVGDTFVVHVLNEMITYEVDQILIVLPEEIDALGIDPEQDYFTLVTCTPYGVNSHRLLVRGHRIENEEVQKSVRVVADAIQIEPIIMTPLVAAPMLLALLLYLMFSGKKKK